MPRLAVAQGMGYWPLLAEVSLNEMDLPVVLVLACEVTGSWRRYFGLLGIKILWSWVFSLCR